MKHIVIATDFSENAKHAADYALEMNQTEWVEFHLVNCYDAMVENSEGLSSVNDVLEEKSRKKLEREAQRILLKNKNKDLTLKSVPIAATPSSMLNEYAKEHNIHEIVIGTIGATVSDSVMVGSTTLSVARSAPCPVLIIPHNVIYQKPRKVVLAIDYQSFGNLNLLNPIRELATTFKFKILILHIKSDDQRNAEQLAKLSSFFQGIAKFSFHTLINKQPDKGIKKFVTKNQPDMLIMMPGDQLEMHQSTTQSIIADIQIPLLTIHTVNEPGVAEHPSYDQYSDH